MRNFFPIFQSHIDLAHSYWSQLVQPGDIVIDATCGNGHDTLFLCKLAIMEEKGKVYAMDNQSLAIQSTRDLLHKELSQQHMDRVVFLHQDHSHFPHFILGESIRLIVYNLGYLPGQNKNWTTLTETTLESIQRAQQLIQLGGAISITCYPGHPEGEKELAALLCWCSNLSPKYWSCCQHLWLNRVRSPTLLFLQKSG